MDLITYLQYAISDAADDSTCEDDPVTSNVM